MRLVLAVVLLPAVVVDSWRSLDLVGMAFPLLCCPCGCMVLVVLRTILPCLCRLPVPWWC